MNTASATHRPSEELFRRWDESKMAMAPNPRCTLYCSQFSSGSNHRRAATDRGFSKGVAQKSTALISTARRAAWIRITSFSRVASPRNEPPPETWKPYAAW